MNYYALLIFCFAGAAEPRLLTRRQPRQLDRLACLWLCVQGANYRPRRLQGIVWCRAVGFGFQETVCGDSLHLNITLRLTAAFKRISRSGLFGMLAELPITTVRADVY